MNKHEIQNVLNKATCVAVLTEIALHSAKKNNDHIGIKIAEHQIKQINEDINFYQGILNEINQNQNLNIN